MSAEPTLAERWAEATKFVEAHGFMVIHSAKIRAFLHQFERVFDKLWKTARQFIKDDSVGFNGTFLKDTSTGAVWDEHARLIREWESLNKYLQEDVAEDQVLEEIAARLEIGNVGAVGAWVEKRIDLTMLDLPVRVGDKEMVEKHLQYLIGEAFAKAAEVLQADDKLLDRTKQAMESIELQLVFDDNQRKYAEQTLDQHLRSAYTHGALNYVDSCQRELDKPTDWDQVADEDEPIDLVQKIRWLRRQLALERDRS